jgi:hypothetical protein
VYRNHFSHIRPLPREYDHQGGKRPVTCLSHPD